MEIIELKGTHPAGSSAVQFHPEFQSKPNAAHPLFAAFIGAAIRHSARQEEAAARQALRPKDKLLLIAGPCSLESEAVCRAVAGELVSLGRTNPELRIIFKGSFDKANRTSGAGARGTGLKDGLALLALVKKEFGLPVLTDIHESAQVEPVAAVCDVLQIPAFLSRQTDLLLAAAATGRTVNVKKGQFLSPQEMAHVTDKLRQGGAYEIWQTERGATFGYQNLVVDMRSFAIMGQNGFPTIFDATHSVQLPGAAGGKSGGQREFVPPLARAALAAGADGLFIETHPDPERALSDGPNMVPLAELPGLVARCIAIWKSARSWAGRLRARTARKAAGLTAPLAAPTILPNKTLMDTFLIDVPMPSMGATVNELTVVSLKIQPGAHVAKGEKMGELESDKSIFEFESPCDGDVKAVLGGGGRGEPSGAVFLQIETSDASLLHLKSKSGPSAASAAPTASSAAAVWTPRAAKLAQEAGLDPAKITDIGATGPGGRISGDDVAKYLEKRKK